jgi:hypothetical protein
MKPTINVTDPKKYSQGYNGQALKVIIIKGAVTPGGTIDAANIAARAHGFNYSVATPITQADEINTRTVRETNYGRQEMGTGRFDVVFNLKANDALPTWQTLRDEPEITILEVTGDDHPDTVDGVPVILNAFVGGRIINKASATMVNQQKVLNVDVAFREHYNGAEWKKLAGDAFNYPANVS